MVNYYKSIVEIDSSNELHEYLKKIHVIDIFKGVYEAFPQHAIRVIKFILYAYSVESEMVSVSGGSWEKLSQKIADKVGLDPTIVDVEMILEHENTRDAINRWLQFQNEENWTQYVTYRDLRKQFIEAALFPLPKYKSTPTKKTEEDGIIIDGNSDAYSRMNNMISAKMNAAENSKKLLDMMKEALEKFVQKHPNLKESISAYDRAGNRNNTTSIEKFI